MATITGTDASDFLVGTDDADIVNGGLGNDTIRGLGGNDTINGAEGNDDLDGGDDNDYLIGAGGNDTLQGGMNADTLEGGAGNDVLRGGKGFDSLVGGDGDDTLYSGLGQDTMTGGSGADVFVLRGDDPNFPGALKAPTITDFVAGTDTIAIQGATADEITTALSGQTTVDGGVSFSINGATVVVKGSGLTSLSADDVTTEEGIPENATGQTFSLTTGADNISGTDGGDTISAPVSGTAMTFGALDTIDGGAGTDTLTISINAAGTYQAASLKNVENINVADSNGSTLSLLGATGVSKVASTGSTAAATITNIGSGVDVEVTNTNQNATFTFLNTALAGAADVVNLSLKSVTGGTTTIQPTSGTNGAETIAITSSTGANTITLDDGTSTSLSKITVAGDQNLTLTTTPTTVATIDASTFTGGLTYTVNSATAATVTGGSGNDSLSFSAAVNDSVNAGAGNDTITFTANLTNADTINGGDGTDVLASTSALLTGYTAPTTATITNIETLRVTDALGAALTTATVAAGIDTVDLAAGSGTFAVTMEAGDKTVNIGAANTGVLTVNDTGTAITDSLTLANTAAATNVFNGQNLIVNGFETVTINTSGTGAATAQTTGTIAVTADTGGTATVNFVGSNGITTNAITAGVISAAGLTGTAALTMNAAAVNVTSITGSANGDTLVGDASSSIDGGAGNDTITGGANNDTLNGGDGNDSITSGAGNDVINGGAGNDTIVMAANYTTGDVIDGGDGTDTLSITTAGATTLAGLSISAITNLNAALSNVERLLVSDQFNVGAAFDVARVDSISYITLADGINGNEELSGLANNATVVVNADNNADTDILTLTLADATGSTDTLNYSMVQAADDHYGVLAVSGVETLNISVSEATANATVRVATLGLNITTATAGTTVNFSGTESITVDTVIAAQTIDATGLTSGNFIMTNTTGSSLSQTIRTGSGADSIYGGAGADTIDAGAGGDSIVGGSGADSITGGDGADTIVGGSGNDRIVLTESTAASDQVTINYSEGGASIDTVTGFTAGATAGDVIALSLGSLEAVTSAGGIFSTATNFEELNNGTDVGTGAATLELITGAATIAAGTDIIGLQGATFSTADEVEDALETGGAFALTVDAAAADANNAFFIVYSDGTNAKVAAVHIVAETTDNTVFETGNLNVIDLVTIEGVSSIGATTFVSTNFTFVA